MKKFINDRNIIIFLVVCNVVMALNNLMDYKTDRLIDTSFSINGACFIYKK